MLYLGTPVLNRIIDIYLFIFFLKHSYFNNVDKLVKFTASTVKCSFFICPESDFKPNLFEFSLPCPYKTSYSKMECAEFEKEIVCYAMKSNMVINNV